MSCQLTGRAIVLGLLTLAVPTIRADYSPEDYKADVKLFADAKLSSKDADLVDFFRKDDQAMGRPVGVTFVKMGALLVADDVGGVVWRVTPR